jgi:hypothetical protein
MSSNNDLCFIYVVGGNDSHYRNLQTSISSVRKIYPFAKILVGDFDLKFRSDNHFIEVIDLSKIVFDKNKTYKHIVWQYKYYVAQLSSCKYNLYLDTDTVLVNNLNNLIEDSGGKFTIAKHFWIPTVSDFFNKAETEEKTFEILKEIGLDNNMDFCAAGVFFFESNNINLLILKDTFELHNKIYNNQDYILGVYDEPILNSVLQKNINHVVYYNGALNHCSMVNMPMIVKNDTLYGKNSFDIEYKPITCLHCDQSRRDPSSPYTGSQKEIILKLFNI